MKATVQRDTKQAMIRGFKRSCPRCGKAYLFDGYLAVSKDCSACNLDLTPQRADDGPAYLTIIIVGHLLVPFLIPAYKIWDLQHAIVAIVFSTFAVVLSLVLLPRLKGALIGFQWAKQMHGF